MSLDLTPLVKIIARLQEGLNRYQADPSDTQIRDGLIQRFEFTYELSHKMLKRYLESTAANPTEFDQADFQYLIRSGSEHGVLLGDWAKWKVYRDMRAKTRHTYDEEVALQVVAGIPAFVQEATHLCDELKKESNIVDNPLVGINATEWRIVRDILKRHVPTHEVWAFGSRAKGMAKTFSDLDLAVIGDQPMSLSVSAALADDFAESDLPFKVDVVDWATTSASFRKIIERDKVVVQHGCESA